MLQLKIEAIKWETPDTATFFLSEISGKKIIYKAGQLPIDIIIKPLSIGLLDNVSIYYSIRDIKALYTKRRNED